MNKYIPLVLAVLLSACGFRLAGSDPAVSAGLSQRVWAVQGGAMQQVLETELLRRHARVDNAFAGALLQVKDLETRRDIHSINLSGTVKEYMLVLRVKAEVRFEGREAVHPLEVTVRRPLDYHDRDILGKQEEEALLWAEMRADAAQQLVRRLGYLKAE